MNHHDNVYYQRGFLQSILTSNGVPMALAHLNLQVKKKYSLSISFICTAAAAA